MTVGAVGRLDRGVVLAALRARDVLTHYQIAGKARGNEFRTRLCPTCGMRSRDSVVINLVTGRWIDQAHHCSGDLLAFVAGCAGLDPKHEFGRVLDVAASIAGIGPELDPQRTAALIAQRKAEEERLRAQKALERSRSIEKAKEVWRDLLRHCLVGEKYLAERGLDAAELIRQDCVRFHPCGHPCVALWSSKGEVINVVRRSIDAGRTYIGANGETCVVPKTPGLPGCPTAGTLMDSILRGVIHLAVVTEGVMDTLTACLAWPGALVLGAHGAGEFAKVTGVVARLMARLARPRVLTLVGHNDPAQANGRPGAGPAALRDALCRARAAGLDVEEIQVLSLGDHKDLNEAWKAGWRP